MTTFLIKQSDSRYSATAAITVFNVKAGNWLVVGVSERSGNFATDLSISDNSTIDVGGGTWTPLVGGENERLNTSARCALRTFWRKIEAGEDATTFVISASTPADASMQVVEIEPSGVFDPVYAGGSIDGGGTGPLDGTATSTGSISGSDLCHVFIQAARQGSAIGGLDVDEYTLSTEYAEEEAIEGANKISGHIGLVLAGRAGGVFTVTSNITGGATEVAAAEGMIAQLVFEDGASGGTTITGTGSLTAAAVQASGAGAITRKATATLAAPAPAAVATGAVVKTGTAPLVAPQAVSSGEGQVGSAISGNSSLNSLVPVTSASGVVSRIGSSAVTVPLPSTSASGGVSGQVSGTSSMSAPSPEVDGSGYREIMSIAAMLLAAVALSGIGSVNGSLNGSGAFGSSVPQLSAVGTVERKGTVSLSAPNATVEGTGTKTSVVTGAGVFETPPASLYASSSRVVTGVSSPALPSSLFSSAAVRNVTGVGFVSGTLPVVSTVGQIARTGTSSLITAVPQAQGVGTRQIVGLGSVTTEIPVMWAFDVDPTIETPSYRVAVLPLEERLVGVSFENRLITLTGDDNELA